MNSNEPLEDRVDALETAVTALSECITRLAATNALVYESVHRWMADQVAEIVEEQQRTDSDSFDVEILPPWAL